MRNRYHYALAGAALVALGIAPFQAHAGSIVDPASYLLFANIQDGPGIECTSPPGCATPGKVGVILPPTNDDPYTASAGASVSGSPSPSISATATVQSAQQEIDSEPVSPQTATAAASLTYFFELTALAINSPSTVPVLMTGSSSFKTTSITPDDFTVSSASMQVSIENGSTLYTLPSNNNGMFSQPLTITPGVEYEVFMGVSAEASVAADNDSDHSLTALAMIDPIFTISPDCNCTNDFQFAFSPDIGNSALTTTPLPSTWAMMLTGLAGLGFVAYRRQKNVAPAGA